MPKGIMSDIHKDITVSMKGRDGSTVTYKSPTGSSMDMSGILGGMVNGFAPTPVADNRQINVTPGEFVVNQPAAQKYKGILTKINNEGRQMLAQGGWTGKKNYADGGQIHTTPDELYNQLQEDLPYIEEMIQGGKSVADVSKYYIDSYGLAPTDTTYGVIGEVYDEVVAASAPGGYATDSTPITASANPAMKAKEFAEVNGLIFDGSSQPVLEGLVREAVEDWAGMPQHEKSEWGSIDELIDYYLNDGATEEGLYDSHYKEDVAGYATGGMVNSPLSKTLAGNSEFVSRVKAAAAKGMPTDKILGAVLADKRLSSTNPMEAYKAIKQVIGAKENFWTGGEVGKGDPDEGDTFSHKGQTVYYKNGQWVYKKGTPAPGYIVNAISAASKAFNETPTEGNQSDSVAQGSDTPAVEKETHAKNYAWGKRAIEAEKVIRELIAGGFNPGSFEYAKGETVANFLGDIARTEDGQRYKKAVESLVAAVLRKDTGAAIAADEFDRTYRQLFGSFGTGKAAQEDAANQRKQNIEGFISASGPAADDLKKQSEGLFEKPGASGESIFTGQDIGGAIGGTALGIAGGIFGGPLGAAVGSGAGTYLGRAVGEWLTSDSDVLESLTPEANDVIDTALATVGGGALKVGSSAYKAAKAEIARRWAKSGKKDASVVSELAENIAEKGIIKGTATAVAGGARKVAGKIAPQIADQAKRGKWQFVEFGNKPFFRDQAGNIIDGVTGSVVKGKTRRDVIKQLPEVEF